MRQTSQAPEPDLHAAMALSGFTIAVTADRRRDELAELLHQRGARVVPAQALRLVPLADESALRAACAAVVRKPPDILAVTTAVGLRGWFEAADRWGVKEALMRRLRSCRIVARGPKAEGAVQAAGLSCAFTTPTDSSDALLDYLLGPQLPGGLAGRRIAVQLYGGCQPEFVETLRRAGAEVVDIPAYRWMPPVDSGGLRRVVDLLESRLVDAVTFSSAPAVHALLTTAGSEASTVISALRGDVLAACIGPTTAGVLRRLDVPAIAPEVTKFSALADLLTEELPRRTTTLTVAGTAVTLRGHAAVVDGALKPLAPAPMAILRALAAAPGRVLSRTALLHELPRGADEHAVEMAVARLRAALGGSGFVQTVVKRGYRLRVD